MSLGLISSIMKPTDRLLERLSHTGFLITKQKVVFIIFRSFSSCVSSSKVILVCNARDFLSFGDLCDRKGRVWASIHRRYNSSWWSSCQELLRLQILYRWLTDFVLRSNPKLFRRPVLGLQRVLNGHINQVSSTPWKIFRCWTLARCHENARRATSKTSSDKVRR